MPHTRTERAGGRKRYFVVGFFEPSVGAVSVSIGNRSLDALEQFRVYLKEILFTDSLKHHGSW